MKTIVVVALALAALVGSGCSVLKSKQPETVAPSATVSRNVVPAAASPAVVKKSVSAKEPSTYASLQPFKKFEKGTGHGMARVYKPRTKAQLIALLKDEKLAKKEMRVSCEVLVRQMVEAHPGLPFENCEGAATELASNDYQVIACKDEMSLKASWLTVTDPKGSSFGVWHRKCLPKEKVLAYKGRVLVSMMCLNVAIPLAVSHPLPAVTKSTAVFTTSACPKGKSIFAFAFSLSAMPNDLRERIKDQIAAANARNSQEGESLRAYQTEAVSRTYGKRLLAEVPLFPMTANSVVRYVDRGTGTEVLRFQNIGILEMANGKGVFKFADDPLAHEAVSFVWPSTSGLVSPTLSGPDEDLGREIRIFPYEWVECKLFMSLIVP